MYTNHGTRIQRADGAFIPLDPMNTDYAEYLAWVTAGNVPGLPPQPTVPELIAQAKAETRLQRQPIIEILDGLQASALTLGETSKAQVIETAKQALRDITNTSLADCTTHEEMRLKIKARYMEIASASPALKAAFSDALK